MENKNVDGVLQDLDDENDLWVLVLATNPKEDDVIYFEADIADGEGADHEITEPELILNEIQRDCPELHQHLDYFECPHQPKE